MKNIQQMKKENREEYLEAVKEGNYEKYKKIVKFAIQQLKENIEDF